jgi:hypothetical protein
MRFVSIKKARPLKDGRETARAFLCEKDRKLAECTSVRHISSRKPVLITGAHHSGKSYVLGRLHADAGRLWSSREAAPLLLSASASVSAWTDGPHLSRWWKERAGNPDDGDERVTWSKLKPHEKQGALPLYLKETKAVLFLDDAHLLTNGSNKGKLAQKCIRAAGVFVLAAADEGRLFPGLREDVLKRKPQYIRLDSDVAYDATPVIIWILVTIAFGLGWWEAGAALGSLRLLGSGKRATRQA